MRGIVDPHIVADVHVGVIEEVISVDVDDHVVVPPVAAASDRRADGDPRTEGNDVAGDEDGRRPVERLILRVIPTAIDLGRIVHGNVVDVGISPARL